MSVPRSFVNGNFTLHSRGYLPHWELPGSAYFITFRLADSLPKDVVVRLVHERSILANGADPDHAFALRLDEALDAGNGSRALNNPEVANVVANALTHFDGPRYDLLTWCVMPNHVHVLARFHDHESLASVVHSWKSFTAHRANEILNREGRFWAREYYDRIMRDEGELRDTSAYIMRNPDKAGLVNWPWVGTVL